MNNHFVTVLMCAMTLSFTLGACTESPEDDHPHQDSGMPDMGAFDMVEEKDVSIPQHDMDLLERDALMQEDLFVFDLAVADASIDQAPDEDASPDMPEELDMHAMDMAPPGRTTVANLRPQQSQRSPFPSLVATTPPANTPPPSVLFMEGKLRYDPDITDSNGYPFAHLDMPEFMRACGQSVRLESLDFALDETIDGEGIPALYNPYFQNDLLEIKVRGIGESTITLKGTLRMDQTTWPQGCDVLDDLSGDVPFEIVLGVKTEPLTMMTFMQAKPCPIMDLSPPQSGSYKIRGQVPLMDVIIQQSYTDDSGWPFPSNIDPRQPFSLSITGPDTVTPQDDALLWEWLVPNMPYPIDLSTPANLAFEVSPDTEPITSMRSLAYLAGAEGSPVRVESGESYRIEGRVSDRIIVYAADFSTSQSALCSAYFPDTHHPDMRIQVESTTPDVCVFESGWDTVPNGLVHAAEPGRWYVSQGALRVLKSGQCQFTSSFFLDGQATPFHVESMDVNLLKN